MTTKWSRFVLDNHKAGMRPWNYKWMPTKTMVVINNPWRNTEEYFLNENKQVEMRVPVDMNKFEIREYLEKIYGIRVHKVNTLIREGKWKREGRPYKFKKPDWKKAYITLETPEIQAKKLERQQAAAAKQP